MMKTIGQESSNTLSDTAEAETDKKLKFANPRSSIGKSALSEVLLSTKDVEIIDEKTGEWRPIKAQRLSPSWLRPTLNTGSQGVTLEAVDEPGEGDIPGIIVKTFDEGKIITTGLIALRQEKLENGGVEIIREYLSPTPDEITTRRL